MRHVIALIILCCSTTVYAKDHKKAPAKKHVEPVYTEQDLIKVLQQAAKDENVPAEYLIGICYNESKLNPNAILRHDGSIGAHAYGLCQIHYGTAQDMGFTGSPENLFKPKVNAKYAAKYFAYQLDRYSNDIDFALSAYNAGSALPSRHKGKKVSNQKYVDDVKKIAAQFAQIQLIEKYIQPIVPVNYQMENQ